MPGEGKEAVFPQRRARHRVGEHVIYFLRHRRLEHLGAGAVGVVLDDVALRVLDFQYGGGVVVHAVGGKGAVRAGHLQRRYLAAAEHQCQPVLVGIAER